MEDLRDNRLEEYIEFHPTYVQLDIEADGTTRGELQHFKESLKLTKQSLENLKNEGIPDKILERLQPLEDQEIIGENTFLAAVKKQIGEEQLVEYKERILKHIESDNEIRRCFRDAITK